MALLDINLSGANQPKAEPLAKLMERSGPMNLPILSDWAEAVLETVPYLLLLILVLRYLPGEDAWLYRTFVALVLVLRFGVSFVASMRAWPFGWRKPLPRSPTSSGAPPDSLPRSLLLIPLPGC